MKQTYISLVFFIFIVFFAFVTNVEANQAHELDISVSYAQKDRLPIARIELRIAAPYHAYAHNPGATGKATVLTIHSTSPQNADSATAIQANIRYPRGTVQPDIFTPSQMVHVYENTVSMFADLPSARAGQEFTGQLDALLCSDKHCLPVKHTFTFRLPDLPLPALHSLPWALDYASAQLGIRSASTPLSASGVTVQNSVPLPTLPLSSIPPAQKTTDTGAAPSAQPLPITPPLSSLSTAHANSGVGNFNPSYFEESAEVSGLAKALLLGLLAGALLNVMPCVLPVLTMKASAILLMGEGGKEERYRRFREHSILFALGIMTLFLFLALVLGTAGMIWGQLFQNPWVIMGMLGIVFLLGLSMLGVFTLPVIDLKAAQSSSPRLQAYFTGIIATLLATPCSGPLLGGVLGWAFMQSLPVMVTVFLAVGLGMSAPYLLFAIRPQLVIILPKPGAWMSILEKLVGFFLLGTSVYLLSILPQNLYIPVLSVLLVTALCAWLYGRYASYDAPPRRRIAIGISSVLGLALVIYIALWPSATVNRWENFSPAAFAQLLGREPLLVEFTADWCPNCKLLEQSTLTPKNLQRWHEQYGVRFIRVDLTREDASAQHFLQSLGSSSIPLTALFPVGAKAAEPLVLRDIYSSTAMDAAMKNIFFQQKNK